MNGTSNTRDLYGDAGPRPSTSGETRLRDFLSHCSSNAEILAALILGHIWDWIREHITGHQKLPRTVRECSQLPKSFG